VLAEFHVGLGVEIGVIVLVEQQDIADLRTDAVHARLEAADPVAGAAVAGKLLVAVGDHANPQLLVTNCDASTRLCSWAVLRPC